ncbi:MAG: hypothetical protein U9R79_20600 [Armatimonadota bacterium]|nr:hypothetical protein [Armatimonadota bacterium]
MSRPAALRVLVSLICCELALWLLPAEPAGAAAIVLEDFERGVGDWRTNDREAAGERPSEICRIYTVVREVEAGRQQAALVEFAAARETWASVSLPVRGALWAREGVGQIAMLLKGDGSENTVDLTLRCLLGEERRDVSYVYSLPLSGTQWQRRAVRLFAFKDDDGNPPDAEAIRNAYLLQFVKTGSWPALSFRIDEIIAEPIPGAQPPHPPGAEPLSVRVDFSRTVAPVLGQVGVNLGAELRPILDEPAASAALSRGLQELTPCVVRLRLADFYDERIGDYDLIDFNRAISWITEAGARPLVCLSPARLPATGDAEARWDPDFADVALKVVALRRGGQHLRYYELFDAPLLSGQFQTVAELVAAYNGLASGVLAADPEARVGGPGLSSAWDSRLQEFLEGVETLHFLSLHLYGAHNAVADEQDLFEAAVAGVTSDLPNQLTLAQVRELARELRRPAPDLFVTQMAMNSARHPDGEAADERVHRPFGAAWTAATVLASATSVDKFLHYRLFGAGWGLMNRTGTHDPPWVAAWLLRTYAPRGSSLCQLHRPASDLLVAAVWTPTARNAFVIYAGGEPRSVVIDAWGVGHPLLVRERRLTSTGGLSMSDLPRSAAQSVEFDGPGVCVIQFVTGE